MSVSYENEVPAVSKIVEFAVFKKKRETKDALARGRKPLYVNHAEGSITGSSKANPLAANSEDFADRLVKIRGSLDRINQLMSEIKKLSVRNESKKDGLN